MRNSHEIYSFAIDVLDGQRDVHKVLADILEEQGDRGLVQWARSRKNTPRKRLDFAIGVIPCPQVVVLACDFLEHALRQIDQQFDDSDLHNALVTIRQRLENADRQESLADVRLALNSLSADNPLWLHRQFGGPYESQAWNNWGPGLWHDGKGALPLYVQSANEAIHCLRESDPRKSQHHEQISKVLVRKMAAQLRQIRAVADSPATSGGLPTDRDELFWQRLTTRATLERLLTV